MKITKKRNLFKIFELREGLLKDPVKPIYFDTGYENIFDTFGYNSKKEAIEAITKIEGGFYIILPIIKVLS